MEKRYLDDGEPLPSEENYTLVICEPGERGAVEASHTRGVTHLISPEDLHWRLPDIEVAARRKGHEVIFIKGASGSEPGG